LFGIVVFSWGIRLFGRDVCVDSCLVVLIGIGFFKWGYGCFQVFRCSVCFVDRDSCLS